MVSLNAKCFKYGAPPEHSMHFPGIPTSSFTAVAAGTAYRAQILKENNFRSNGEAQLRNLPGKNGAGALQSRVGDTLPGRQGINEVYSDIGWVQQPSTLRWIPPNFDSPPRELNIGCNENDRASSRDNDATPLVLLPALENQMTPVRNQSDFKDAREKTAPLLDDVSGSRRLSLGKPQRSCSVSEFGGSTTPFSYRASGRSPFDCRSVGSAYQESNRSTSGICSECKFRGTADSFQVHRSRLSLGKRVNSSPQINLSGRASSDVIPRTAVYSPLDARELKRGIEAHAKLRSGRQDYCKCTPSNASRVKTLYYDA